MQKVSLWQLNRKYIERLPLYTPDQRFEPPTTLEKSCRNQYSRGGFTEQFNCSYLKLISKTVEYNYSNSPFQDHICWILGDNTVGYDQTPNGYTRLNFYGTKVLTHCFVWAYHNPGKSASGDISHLCGHSNCCRPSHLIEEDRNTNLSRRGCPGFAYGLGSCITIRLCRHNPHCQTCTVFDDNIDVLESNSDMNPFAVL